MYIEYTFEMDDGKRLDYHVDFDRPRDKKLDFEQYPNWTKLKFHQCPNCPLHTDEYSHCPAAIDAQEIVMGFNEILSCKATAIHVKTPEREYSKQTDAQTGLRALIGFVMASSACPILSTMRGMAYFHLPFASMDEAVYRISSSYLLNQYFKHKKTGQEPDFEFAGLKIHFQEMQTLNFHFLERIRAGCEGDSNLNVLATLFTISSMLSLSLERHLGEIEHLFD
ncbi:DUF6901 family protein [Candidatus Venteria ishoeyi]|uniref:Uncharacterized protein n=1 Tax=Candidatus Venteria ishoeyi TaxID=1899563 RepID=A0A1H6F968_9GAMM|nr:hypothetical protein [Candidatus Venteria ishoeyi]MDM8545141.1 hypothetical protein [Candidatus Venteria ishoeyi]SEH06658.1 Uncharacterised protein [Candidatus Venteria ishoeyi]